MSLVLNVLRSYYPTSKLTLKQLTHKLLVLIALITAQRLQTLQLLDINNLYFKDKQAVFVLPNKLKQSRPGYKPMEIVLPSYDSDEKLDAYSLLKYYLQTTSSLRGSESQLFISYVPLYKPVSRDTLSRWIKEILDVAGIDTTQYSAHSTRAAVVSAASCKNVPVEDILSTAGWSSEKTFARFYKKPVESSKPFATAVLEA